MPKLYESLVALRIFGDSLTPEEISRSLGREPTKSELKGEVTRSNTGRERTAKTGSWRLRSLDRQPGNIDLQVAELLDGLTQDLDVWATLSGKFKIDLFCGLFMEGSNEGIEISAKTMAALGVRGIELSLDIYGPERELKANDPCPCRSGKDYGECCAIRTTPNI